MSADEINEQIATDALAPGMVQTAEATVQDRSIAEKILAAKHLAGLNAASKGGFGIRISQIVAPGSE